MSDHHEAEPLFDLRGRHALVTGGSRGIGRAIALGLGRCGARVAVHCAGSVNKAREVVEQLPAGGCVVQADLAEDDAPDRIMRQTLDGLGRLDILVLNASVQHRRAWGEPNRAEFDEQIVVNLRSAVELIQRAAPGMVERRWGRILTIGSVQQRRPHPQMVTYGATKAALEHVARNLAKQLAPHGVTVNNLSPGVIETDRNAQVLANADQRRHILAAIPAGRFGQPEDCVPAALLLCSDAGVYITGIDLIVDGGFVLP